MSCNKPKEIFEQNLVEDEMLVVSKEEFLKTYDTQHLRATNRGLLALDETNDEEEEDSSSDESDQEEDHNDNNGYYTVFSRKLQRHRSASVSR